MVVSRFYVHVEGVRRRYVAEVRPTRSVYRPAPVEHDYFGQLPPGHVIARKERAICVARDYSPIERRFNVWVERLGRRHVAEVRPAERIDGPPCGQYDYLGQLPASSVVV